MSESVRLLASDYWSCDLEQIRDLLINRGADTPEKMADVFRGMGLVRPDEKGRQVFFRRLDDPNASTCPRCHQRYDSEWRRSISGPTCSECE